MGQDGGMFGNNKKVSDPKSINTLVGEVEKMKFDQVVQKRPEVKIGGEKVKLNLSVIEETSENTYNGQSLMNINGISRNDMAQSMVELGEIRNMV